MNNDVRSTIIAIIARAMSNEVGVKYTHDDNVSWFELTFPHKYGVYMRIGTNGYNNIKNVEVIENCWDALGYNMKFISVTGECFEFMHDHMNYINVCVDVPILDGIIKKVADAEKVLAETGKTLI